MTEPTRLSRQQIHMATAFIWGSRSVCKRPDRKIGAVITTNDMRRILSIGYNGPPRGCPHNLCSGEEGTCGCVHAETNAIAQVDSTIPKKILFVTMQPCRACAALIIQADITEVYFLEAYRDNCGLMLLLDAGVVVSQMEVGLVREVFKKSLTSVNQYRIDLEP